MRPTEGRIHQGLAVRDRDLADVLEPNLSVHHCAFKKRSFNGQTCRPLTPLRRPPIQ